jgi:two-component system sensor histidine kinase PilS (NtrC family)
MPGRESYPRWRTLTWFAFFRLCLAGALVLSSLQPATAPFYSAPGRSLGVAVSLSYLFLVLLGLLVTRLRWMGKTQLAEMSLYVDIVAFTLLMHASGGVDSGFGLLLAIAVAAGALLLEGRLSLLFAALATLGVMAEQLYAQLHGPGEVGGFTRAGLLGLTYFTVAVLAHVLYRRIRETERLAASRQVDIADLSKLNEFIIQRMGMGVLVLDEGRRIRLMNSAAARLLNSSEDTDRLTLGGIAPELSRWLAARTLGRAQGQNADTITVKERDIEPSFVPLGDSPSAAALIFLRDKRAAIQEAQQIKLASLGRLTASIAHNIRNPLSAVKHAGQLLAESPNLAAEDLQLIDIVLRNTGRIDEIVESVLQLSRRDQALVRRLDLGPWIDAFGAELRHSHQLPGERIAVDVAPDTPAIEADPRHLHQILSNLCDNAVRHAGTPQRPARISLCCGREAGRGPAYIEVSDDGPPIDPGTAREMFAPFFTTSVGGTGLGLYIARELSETNGMGLEYSPGQVKGNCFRLTIPLP